jgi:NAD(P)-dependent dehydrogenase (short-subunit alcohol dehydrogenase family)
MYNYLIIGASSGIGLALANELIINGNIVYGTYNTNTINNVATNPISNKINVLDNNLNFDFLPEKLHGIVYCPGAINLKPFTRIKPEDFLADYNLQVVGAIKCIQTVLPKLKAAENASIIMFSSIAVQLGLNFHSQVSASKGAIEGLTKALSAELAPKIRVNCIAPSLTNTPLAASLLNTEEKMKANAQRHPLKRIGTANDIASMCAFLLSEKASWITGQIFGVDGGLSTIK